MPSKGRTLKFSFPTLGSGIQARSSIREQSFLKLGTGVEEFLEGCQIILPRLIGLSKILAKLKNI